MADTEASVAQPVAALNEVGDTSAAPEGESTPESAAAPAAYGDEDPKKGAAPAAGAARAAAPRKKPPQRELVIPDEPVKRYPEPAKAELDAKVEPLRAQVAEARTKLEAALTHSKARKALLESHEPTISAARKAHKGLQEALNAKFSAKKAITDQIAALRSQEQATRRGGGSGGGSGMESCLRGLKTVEQVEQRIQDLEYRMHTESLSMAEEKKLISTIGFLRFKGRAALVAADAASVNRDELEASRKAQDVLINQLKAAVNEQKRVVDAAFAARNEEIAQLPGAPPQTGDPIAAQKKIIAEAQAAIDAAHKAHFAALNAWRDNERIFRIQEENRRRKKQADLIAARNAEREARRAEREAELAEYEPAHPYAAQLATCTRLIVHLAPMLDGPAATAEALASVAAEDKSTKADDAPTLGLPGATRQGLRVVKDSSTSVATGKKAGAAAPPEDKYSAFGKAGVGKKGRKGKGRRGSDAAAPDAAAAATSAGSAKLPSQSMEIYAAFTAVEVEPPLVMSDVAPAIKALQEKLAYYQTAPPPTQRAPKQEKPFGSSSEKRGASKNATAAPAPSANGDDQPPLVQGVPLPSVPAVVDANKPSFSDIIRGRAVAAAVPVDESPTPAEAGGAAVIPVAALPATNGGDDTETSSDPTVVPTDELANGSTIVTAAELNAVATPESTADAAADEDAAPTKATDAPSTDAANPEGVTA
ncbi:hypothetical protein MMPV_002469 [Pyropia vietnamensis]